MRGVDQWDDVSEDYHGTHIPGSLDSDDKDILDYVQHFDMVVDIGADSDDDDNWCAMTLKLDSFDRVVHLLTLMAGLM